MKTDESHSDGLIAAYNEFYGKDYPPAQDKIDRLERAIAAYGKAALAAQPQAGEPVALLVDRARDVLEWHKTGLLPDGALRSRATELVDICDDPFDVGHALHVAEKETATEAMRFVIEAASSAPTSNNLAQRQMARMERLRLLGANHGGEGESAPNQQSIDAAIAFISRWGLPANVISTVNDDGDAVLELHGEQYAEITFRVAASVTEAVPVAVKLQTHDLNQIVLEAVNAALRAEVDPVLSFDIIRRLASKAEAVRSAVGKIKALVEDAAFQSEEDK